MKPLPLTRLEKYLLGLILRWHRRGVAEPSASEMRAAIMFMTPPVIINGEPYRYIPKTRAA